jgi:ribosomal protein S18 acetylase RimI-like enzyme
MFEEKSLAPRVDECCFEVPAAADHLLIDDLLTEDLLTDVSAVKIRLVPVRASDEDVLYQTFASTRTDEMALTGWNAEQQEAFLRMQYDAQRRSYLMQIPGAEYFVIRCGESAAGRLIVERTAQRIHIVDIALLPEFRARKIGSTLMAAIMGEASQGAKAVSLHVERFNPALRWYERLGFNVVESGPIYLEMVWRPNSEAPVEPRVSGSKSAEVQVEG